MIVRWNGWTRARCSTRYAFSIHRDYCADGALGMFDCIDCGLVRTVFGFCMCERWVGAVWSGLLIVDLSADVCLPWLSSVFPHLRSDSCPSMGPLWGEFYVKVSYL